MKKRSFVKRYIIVSVVIVLAVQAIYFLCKDPHMTGAEKEYREKAIQLEGTRVKYAEPQIQEMKTEISEAAYGKLWNQKNWMTDMELARGTYQYNEKSGEKGYILMPMTDVGMEDFFQDIPVPLFVYPTGYQYLFGETDDYYHYINATLIILFLLSVMLIFQRGKEKPVKIPVWGQILTAVCIAVITTLPELIWVLMNFGVSGAEYPVISVSDIGGGSIAGIIRILFIMRIFGILMLASIYIFINRCLYSKPKIAAVIVAAVGIIPVWLVYFWDNLVIAASFSNLIVGTSALKYRFDYVGVLCLLTVLVVVFCRFFPLFHYSKEDIERMKRHFHDSI